MVKRLEVGVLGTNCCLLVNPELGEAVILDPGGEHERILSELSALGAKPVAILLTHAHYDHTMAISKILRKCGSLPIAACEKERAVFEDRSLNCSTHGGVPSVFMPDVWVKEGDVLTYAGADLRVMETPGHTVGSICLYLDRPVILEEEEEKFGVSGLLFSGDTLFYRSFGRTDLPTGNMDDMWSSLMRLMKELPGETVVIPGHGPLTTIGFEKRIKGIR